MVVFTHSLHPEFKEKFEECSKSFSTKPFACLDLSGPIGPVQSGPIGPGTSGPIGPAQSGPIGPDSSGSIGPALKVIHNKISSKYELLQQKDPILLERHCMVLKELYKLLKLLENDIEQNGQDIGIIDFRAQEIGQKIAELIGVLPPDEVLGDIFANFCIGK